MGLGFGLRGGLGLGLGLAVGFGWGWALGNGFAGLQVVVLNAAKQPICKTAQFLVNSAVMNFGISTGANPGVGLRLEVGLGWVWLWGLVEAGVGAWLGVWVKRCILLLWGWVGGVAERAWAWVWLWALGIVVLNAAK